MRLLFWNKKKEKEYEDEKRKELLMELDEAKNAINAIYTNFSYIVEPDMIDCCIYELNALQLRYKILLNQVKNEEDKKNKEDIYT